MNSINKQDLEVVNFYDEVMVIKKRYDPNYWRNPKALKELADLWGALPNDSMVLPHETETIVDIGKCKGQIHFSRTSKDIWLTGLSASSAFNERGYSPSMSDCIGYRSYQSARKDGVKRLIYFFDTVARDLSSCNSKANKVNALKAVSFLKEELTPQLNLFD